METCAYRNWRHRCCFQARKQLLIKRDLNGTENVRNFFLSIHELLKNFSSATSDCRLIPRVSGNCDNDERYRSISGVCNNIRHPEWGSINQELNRILPPAYKVWKEKLLLKYVLVFVPGFLTFLWIRLKYFAQNDEIYLDRQHRASSGPNLLDNAW